MRTYAKGDWIASRRAWEDGDFTDEWSEVRQLAAVGGIIWPPAGTALDAWDVDRPSQRAAVARAMRETPGLLADAIAASASWRDVVAKILERRDAWRRSMAADVSTTTTRPRASEWSRVDAVLDGLLRPGGPS